MKQCQASPGTESQRSVSGPLSQPRVSLVAQNPGKESSYNVGDPGSTSGLGISPRKWNSYPLQYSVLENSLDRRVHGVTKSQI